MSEKIVHVKKMSNKPLSLSIYLDYLKERLADENKGHLRKYIRSKLKRLTVTKEKS
jgi:hypothetical protein